MISVISAILGALLIGAASLAGLYILESLKILAPEVDKKLTRLPFVIVVTSVTAVVWLVSSIIHTKTLPLAATDAVLAVFMVLLACVDHYHRRVPNKILLVMLAVWVAIISLTVIFETGKGIELFARSLAGALFSGVIFLLCYIVTHHQLGGGDVKLAFLLGLYLNNQRIAAAIFYGVLICCIYSIVLLLRKKISAKDGVPLVPFLQIGVLITFLIAG